MALFDRITSLFGGTEKSITGSGGFELLKRIAGQELTKTSQLEQYRKSLYVFACVSKIAEKVSSMDLDMYRIVNSKGEVKEVEIHPVLDLLYRPNPFQTKNELLEILEINLKLAGDAFIYKVRNNSGRVVELWNIRPDKMTIIADPMLFIKGYELNKDDGTKVTFAAEEIVHFKYANPLSDYYGHSPIKSAETRIQTEAFASEYQRDFFLNNGRPDAVIKNQNATLTTEQKEDIREGWRMTHQGRGNNSKVAILEGGLEYQQISISQREMDFIESMKFTRDDILVAYKVPKPIVAIVDDVNRANSETAMHIFLSETIAPEMRRIVEKLNEELVVPDFGEEYYLDCDDPTPENRELVLKEYETGLMQGYLLVNEVRQKEGLEPIAGGWTSYRPISDVPVGGLLNGGTGPTKGLSVMGGISKKDAYEIMPKVKEKRVSMHGRLKLRMRFEVEGIMKSSIVKMVDAKAKGKKAQKVKKAAPVQVKKVEAKKEEPKAERVKVSILVGEDLRRNYWEVQMKKVDAGASRIEGDVVKFFMDQKERVIKKLAKLEGKAEKISVSVSRILNEEKETGIAVSFITPYLESFLSESAKEALALVAPQIEWNANAKEVARFLKQRSELFGESVTATTKSKLEASLAEGIAEGESITELADRVGELYDDMTPARAALIARTEATAANNAGLVEGWRQSGIANGKEWINVGDDRVRDEHQDGIGVGGEIVLLDEDFSNGLSEPSEPNCRCTLGPAYVEG